MSLYKRAYPKWAGTFSYRLDAYLDAPASGDAPPAQ